MNTVILFIDHVFKLSDVLIPQNSSNQIVCNIFCLHEFEYISTGKQKIYTHVLSLYYSTMIIEYFFKKINADLSLFFHYISPTFEFVKYYFRLIYCTLKIKL